MANSPQELVTNYLHSQSTSSVNYDSSVFWEHIYSLHSQHIIDSPAYALIAQQFPDISPVSTTIPYIPVSLFKYHDLISIPSSLIYRTLLSSGTSGQLPSKIYLDRENSKHQQVALSRLFSNYTGFKRPNILIVDSPIISSRSSPFTARKAGILGFSSLCRKSFFALNDDYSINYDSIRDAIASSRQLLVFGFTFIIYQYFLSKIIAFPDIPSSTDVVLLHGGGWKKLESLRLNTFQFRKLVNEKTNINTVLNYYGMVEQTGSLFFECPSGFMHTNSLASVIPRDIKTLQPDFSNGPHARLLQVVSALPSSYPGHSLLTDDIASIPFPIDQCSCGLPGLAFQVLGRLPKSEVRGCSDTHQSV